MARRMDISRPCPADARTPSEHLGQEHLATDRYNVPVEQHVHDFVELLLSRPINPYIADPGTKGRRDIHNLNRNLLDYLWLSSNAHNIVWGSQATKHNSLPTAQP